MKRLLIMLTVCLLLGTVWAGAAYTSSDWAKEELTQAENAGLIPGQLEDKNLTKPITRAEYAAAALALFNSLPDSPVIQVNFPMDAEIPVIFTDCQDESVLWAFFTGIVKGFPDGTFRPNDLLTREQAATMLLRVCQNATVHLPAATCGVAFTDRASIGDWAWEAVETLAGVDVIRGRDTGAFDPKASVTRQEALVMNERVASFAGAYDSADTFGAKLMGQLAEKTNPVLSPVSAELALGLLQPGTAGETKAELDTLLNGVDFSKWMDTLKTGAGGPTVEVANSLWFDNSVTPDKNYLDTVSKTFGAECRTLDLTGQSAVTAINGWVKEKTHDLIPAILDGPLGKDAASVLINALYFNGKWTIPFEPTATWEQSFRNASGKTASVPFMHDTRHGMFYISTEDCTGVALPYRGDGDWQLICLMPKNGASPESLAGQNFAALLNNAKVSYVRLSLPKFTLEGTYELTGPLQAMGLTKLFSSDADLTPMGTCSKGPMAVSEVLQKTYLRVDEEGTEAAAVTAIITKATSAMPEEEPIEVTFNRPFLCCLWNGEIGEPLFLAAVEELA